MKPLDLFHIPLEGTHLIEASAGTGKTYTIASLYVRLLLQTMLRVREILVVTYTEAATDELKGRIRSKLHDALRCFETGVGTDPFLLELVKRCENPGHAVQRLEYALRRFDESSIFTIHGFCQRVLSELAFESRSLFDHELITDQTELVREVVGDFYRMHFTSSMPPELAHYALRKGYSFSFFLQLYLKASLDVRVIPDTQEPEIHPLLQAYRESFDALRRCWMAAGREVVHLLMNDAGLNRNKYRQGGILRMAEDMDAYIFSGGHALPLFRDFSKFTSSAVRSSVNKGFEPLEHEFFRLCESHRELCEDLTSCMDRILVWLKVQMFRYVRSHLPGKKDALGVVHFDDLLLKVRDCLASDHGSALKENLSERYRAALIDEFQDTDPIQYEIFSTVFSGAPLFLIGDPKQAIYSFRGADIFTYLNAAGEVWEDARHTLERNWRSEPGLVEAVNRLFAVKEPFVFKEIPFKPALSGEIPSREVLRDAGGAPLTIWYAGEDSHSGLNRRDAEKRISHALAWEISRLLTEADQGNAMLGERPVAPRDVAVIVRENSQGRLVRDVLASCGIPCVISSDENVFDTHEAREMEFLLRAVAQPYSEPFIRTALAGPLFGLDASEIDRLEKDERTFEMWIERFRQYHDIWEHGGFMRMFRKLLTEENVRARLLKLPRGERMLTNFLHLSEVLNQVSMEGKLGMGGLLKWLNQQRDPSMPRSEEHQIRLESDDDAVKVITVHKSKGLEFPIVFCPFLWGASELRDKANIPFHDSTRGYRAFLDLGSDSLEDHRIAAERELLAENMRLVYVALTRARNRCYLVWGKFLQAETSALAYLFERHADGDARTLPNPDGDTVRKRLERLCLEHKGCMTVKDLPREIPSRHVRRGIDASRISCRAFSGFIDKSWGISSFSSMVLGSPHAAGAADRDFLYASPADVHDGEGQGVRDIFRFPRGARAGIMLHAIFESLDFQAGDSDIAELAARMLKLHGFESDWAGVIADMVKKVLSAPLDGTPLSSVRSDAAVRELEFYLPVKRLSKQMLQDIFRGCGSDTVPESFPGMMEDLRFDETTGFLKGFIDLVFRSGGKYYLLDWKSNHLGDGIEHYSLDAMMEAMVKNYYILQYHLYTTALHRYLQSRLKGYSYKRHFGGIIYVFLRGVDPAQGREYGLYHRVPEQEIIAALNERLAQ